MFSVGQVHADLCSYCITNNEDQSVTIENVQATEQIRTAVPAYLL